MSGVPSLSTSKTPAASKTLLGLMSCFFHFGSPATAAAATARTMKVGIMRGMGGSCRVGRAQRAPPSSKMVGLAALDPPHGSIFVQVIVLVGVDLPAEGPRGGLDDR